MATIKQLLSEGEAALSDNGNDCANISDSVKLDAEILLGLALSQTRTWLYTWPEHIPSLPEKNLYRELISRRRSGEPIAYLTGSRAFWTLDLAVNQHVLIPRPETELLVETALDKLSGLEEGRIVDLGTGSGAIALALSSEKPEWQLTATDSSAEALSIAQENARINKLTNVSFLEGDWTDPLKGSTFNAILSNPPYIEQSDPHLQQGDVRFEPEYALVSAENGFADIYTIINDCHALIEAEGWLMIEHGYQQGKQVRQMFTKKGFIDVETKKDLSGNERVSIGRKR